VFVCACVLEREGACPVARLYLLVFGHRGMLRVPVCLLCVCVCVCVHVDEVKIGECECVSSYLKFVLCAFFLSRLLASLPAHSNSIITPSHP
jgi:hypothetical protein